MRHSGSHGRPDLTRSGEGDIAVLHEVRGRRHRHDQRAQGAAVERDRGPRRGRRLEHREADDLAPAEPARSEQVHVIGACPPRRGGHHERRVLQRSLPASADDEIPAPAPDDDALVARGRAIAETVGRLLAPHARARDLRAARQALAVDDAAQPPEFALGTAQQRRGRDRPVGRQREAHARGRPPAPAQSDPDAAHRRAHAGRRGVAPGTARCPRGQPAAGDDEVHPHARDTGAIACHERARQAEAGARAPGGEGHHEVAVTLGQHERPPRRERRRTGARRSGGNDRHPDPARRAARRDHGRDTRDDSDKRREYQQQPHAGHFRSSSEVPMPDVMNARDEPARGAGEGGHSHDRRLPGAGDFRALVEKLPLIVYIDAPDPVSPSLYVSPQTVEVLGYTQEEWASSPDFFVGILHPDDRERVVAETSHMIETGERLLSEYRLRRPDGSFAWVRDEGVLVRDSDGEPLWMQGYIQDITEARQREAELLESNARTQAMLDAALDGVITVDHGGAIVEFNPAAESIFGYARDAALGRQMSDLIVQPAVRKTRVPVFRHYLATSGASDQVKRIEAVGVRADGCEFPLELSIAEVDVPGEPLHTVYVRDITDQKLREAALLESEAIVGSSFEAIVGRTVDGIITSWNAAAERIFGYTADEVLGGLADFLVVPDSGVMDYVNERLTRGEVVEPIEVVCIRKDGKRIDVESTISPIIGPSGVVIGSSSITRDITERKRSQALVAGQAELLEFVAGGAVLPSVLDHLARFVEEHGDDVIASILLLDRDGMHLRHGAAPSLPADYCEAIDGIAIGPSVGSCGTAAFLRERVCVSDISTDPLWSDYHELAAAAGLGACWSTPIFATDGSVLGTFALYYREPREGAGDVELVELAAHVAGIAIERARSEEAARASEERYRDLFENANEPIATVTLDRVILEVNRAFELMLGYTRDELIGTNLADYLTPESIETSMKARKRELAGETKGPIHEQEF